MNKRIVAAAIVTALPILVRSALGGRVAAYSPAAPAPVRAGSTHILVDTRGMTLYLFTLDKPNQSSCTGQCAVYWPPVLLSSGASAPAAIAGVLGTFGVTTRPDGQRQVTYNGSPLYTFIKDRVPGDVTGQGVQNSWWVAVVTTTPIHPVTAAPTAANTPADDSHNNRHGGAKAVATPRSSCYYGACSSATPTPAGGYYGSNTTSSPTPTAAGAYYSGGHR